MSWQATLTGGVTIKPGGDLEYLTEADVLLPMRRDKLERAALKARMMVKTAVAKIKEYTSSEAMRRAGFDDAPNYEIENAFAKYFNLQPNHPRYWSFVEGILEVYNSIWRGISVSFVIVIYSQDKKADGSMEHGHVLAGPGMDFALGTMLAKMDPMGHVPWGTVNTSEINLNLEWFKAHTISDEEVARTLVHEASHKFAYTNDILYKSNSYKATLSTDPDKLDEVVQLGLQETVTRGGVAKMMAGVGGAAVAKPLYRMMGEKELKPLELLRNADSYSWVARRLWKKAGRPC